MMLSNYTYDKLKWIISIVLPAVATLVNTVGQAVGWPHTELAVLIITAVTTFLGSVFMVSSHNYNNRGDDRHDL